MARRSKEEKSDKKLKPFDHRYRITMKASHRIENSCRAAKMHQKISFRRKILFFLLIQWIQFLKVYYK
jgi:hypothetical protein